MADIAFGFGDDLGVEFQSHDFALAHRADHVQVETTSARAVEDHFIVRGFYPFENRLDPFLESHICFVTGQTLNSVLVDYGNCCLDQSFPAWSAGSIAACRRSARSVSLTRLLSAACKKYRS